MSARERCDEGDERGGRSRVDWSVTPERECVERGRPRRVIVGMGLGERSKRKLRE